MVFDRSPNTTLTQLLDKRIIQKQFLEKYCFNIALAAACADVRYEGAGRCLYAPRHRSEHF